MSFESLVESGIVFATVIVPWIQAIVEMIKPFIQDERFYPALSMLIGMGLMLAVALLFQQPIPTYIMSGFLAGLGASGFYDLNSKTFQRRD